MMLDVKIVGTDSAHPTEDGESLEPITCKSWHTELDQGIEIGAALEGILGETRFVWKGWGAEGIEHLTTKASFLANAKLR
jgi:hypothetical protein